MLWEKLKTALSTGGSEAASAPETELATAVLLYEIASADMEIADAENETLQRLLAALPGVDPETCEALMARAASHQNESVSLHEYADALNARCSFEEKRHLVRMIWEVAYADGVLDAHEEHMVRRLADLLFVPHSVFIQEKLAVEATHRDGGDGEAAGRA
ncbi:tellurite resistance TerB family protein [Algiphilus aromaticivorans]|uniref:tellurite resistance TerB family protein n=1 Tax=Algiphilus aromaticivorans TaxID=382454 RepID=UPI0006942C31|nr:TerB family tellurite resistance protein [Algiphilus aromaticivorans]